MANGGEVLGSGFTFGTINGIEQDENGKMSAENLGKGGKLPKDEILEFHTDGKAAAQSIVERE